MADFTTHIFSAAAVGSLGATLCSKLLALPPQDSVALTLAAVAGGILPDIDLKVSVPSRLLFALLGGIVALVWLFAYLDALTVLELWLAAVGLFLLVRYPIRWLFNSTTVHRGSLHSIAAAVMATLVTATGASSALGQDAAMSWLLATFVATGYVLHLALDELYSVDISGMSVKRSFGSALKLVDRRRRAGSFVVIAVALAAGYLAPDVAPFIEAWRTVDARWEDKILPAWLFATRY